MCQDYSFWSNLESSCIDNSNDSQRYPNVRKCNKMGQCGNAYHFDEIDTCPTPKSTKTGDFYCEKSMSWIKEKDKCDGIVHCYHGEDEDWELCKDRYVFPEAATIQCQENFRGIYNMTTMAVPCNGIAECKDWLDEQCVEDIQKLLILFVIGFVGILVLCLCLNLYAKKKYHIVKTKTDKGRGNKLAKLKEVYIEIIN